MGIMQKEIQNLCSHSKLFLGFRACLYLSTFLLLENLSPKTLKHPQHRGDHPALLSLLARVQYCTFLPSVGLFCPALKRWGNWDTFEYWIWIWWSRGDSQQKHIFLLVFFQLFAACIDYVPWLAGVSDCSTWGGALSRGQTVLEPGTASQLLGHCRCISKTSPEPGDKL